MSSQGSSKSSSQNQRSTASRRNKNAATTTTPAMKSMSELAAVSDDQYLNYIGNFKPGSITKICLSNFLTYKSAIITPGPRLNVVAGANGTGKSTILNAICLGLGGDPKLLGRAEDVRDFVMHNETLAQIEISLQNENNKDGDDDNSNNVTVIKRVIDKRKGTEKGKGRGSSVFYLNGEKVTIKEIQELVRTKFSIQIDNLCTFLPQDKVGNFSALSPQELLLETEKVLSRNGYYIDTHKQLISQQDAILDEESDLLALQSKLKAMKQDQEQLERAKEKMEERLLAMEQLELLQKKALWLEFEALRLQALDLKKLKSEVRDKVRLAAVELQPLQEKVEALEAAVKRIEAHVHATDKKHKAASTESDKQAKKYEKHDDEIEQSVLELGLLDEQRVKAVEQVKHWEGRVQHLTQEKEQLPFESNTELLEAQKETTQRRRQTQEEYNAAKREVGQLHRQFKEVEETVPNLQRKLAKLGDAANQRRDHVFRQFNNMAKVCKWIEDHRGQFRRPVVGPIAAELQPSTPQAAAFLEQHVPKNTLKAFCVETKEDQNLLYQKVRVEMNIPINIILLNSRQQQQRPRLYSSQKMRVLQNEHGIQGYLDELLGACPDAVRQALIDTASIDKVLVGTARTYDNMATVQKLLSQPEGHQTQLQSFVVCCTSINRERNNREQLFKFQGTKSRYANELSMRQDDILPARILSAAGADGGVDHAARLQQAQSELDDAHALMNGELRPQIVQAEKEAQEKETAYQESQAAYNVASKRLDNWKKFEHKYQQAIRKLKEAREAGEQGEEELESQKKQLLGTIQNRVSHSLTALETRGQQQAVFLETACDLLALAANKSCLMVEKRLAELAQVEMKQTFEELNKEAERVQKEFFRVKKEVSTKNAVCVREAPIHDEDGNDLPLRQQMDELGVDTLEQVEVAIEEAESKVNGIDATPDVLRQYEAQKVAMEELADKVEHMMQEKADKTSQMDRDRKRWETNLAEQITVMNSLFTKYMSEMGNAGELMLYKGEADEHGNYGNFKDWGLQIRVSFRGESKAQVLSAQSHSGGERAVSTIMYLMGCQDMLVSPFRCVDEINQGLDERNERLVFSRIVANACGLPPATNPLDHSGQYFLITPKLLPNLEDMDHPGITVLTVINGPYNNVKELCCDSLLRLAKENNKKRSMQDAGDEEDGGDDNNNYGDDDDDDEGEKENQQAEDDENIIDDENQAPNSARKSKPSGRRSTSSAVAKKTKRISSEAASAAVEDDNE